MNPELYAAVDRYVNEQWETSCQMIDDMQVICDAHISEHDLSLITPERLEADGWKRISWIELYIQRGMRVGRTNGKWYIFGYEVEVMGQVRTLLRAFGARD